MGPLGGGEAAPLRFFEGLPFKLRAFDALRSLTLLWVRVDPLATWGPRRSALVLCRSADSLRKLPAAVQARAAVVPEIGSPEVDLAHRRALPAPEERRRFRLLFAGRLLGWKGVALTVGAVARLVQAGVDVELQIAGRGPLQAHLQQQIEALGLTGRVRLLGAIPRDELLRLYGQADLFVFPTLHDSSGTVVLESLSRGLPVVCLDLGGPQNYVDASCGIVVGTSGRSRAQLEQALADAVARVLADPARLASLSARAAEHAGRQTWAATVDRAYRLIHSRLGWEAAE